jgi:hypothetical protein
MLLERPQVSPLSRSIDGVGGSAPAMAVRGMSSLAQRLQRVPTPVIDADLAVALAAAITNAIGVSPEPSARHEPAAYALGGRSPPWCWSDGDGRWLCS